MRQIMFCFNTKQSSRIYLPPEETAVRDPPKLSRDIFIAFVLERGENTELLSSCYCSHSVLQG